MNVKRFRGLNTHIHNGGFMQVQDTGASRDNRIANVIGTAIAIAGAIVASPAATERLPAAAVAVLKTVVTLGNTIQPAVATIIGIAVAAVTHPPKWLRLFGRDTRERVGT
ncbi:MAG: hypothetical protein ACR2GG_01235 [Gemmatimonadaceae bacterium]